MKPYLVVLRGGDRSLHGEWFAGAETPAFDLALSYYGKTEPPAAEHARFVHRYTGSKWQGLHDFFTRHGDRIREYRYVWLPDDDLATCVADINELFRLAEMQGFALCQPALSWNSYWSLPITLRNRAFVWRETNFVEVMAPCFSQAALQRVLPSFELNASGWGLDFLWPREVAALGRIGILDAVPVFHTRPVGSAGHGTGAGGAASPSQELHALQVQRDLPLEILCRGGMTAGDNRYAAACSWPFVRATFVGSHPARRRSLKWCWRLLCEGRAAS